MHSVWCLRAKSEEEDTCLPLAGARAARWMKDGTNLRGGRESQRKIKWGSVREEEDEEHRDVITAAFRRRDDKAKRGTGSCGSCTHGIAEMAKKKQKTKKQNMTEFNFIRLKFFLQEKRLSGENLPDGIANVQTTRASL